MRYQLLLATGLIVVSAHGQVAVRGAEQALPIRNGRPVVATVGRDAISLDEFVAEIESPSSRARLRQGRGTAEEVAVLDRLVNIKLVVQEASTMGLAELPEIQKQVEVSSRAVLREVLFEQLTKDVKPDPVEVEKLFRESVRQWKTSSLLFREQAAAQRARMEISNGATFAAVSAKAVAAKSAEAENADEYHARKDYLPQIAEALATLKVGQLSPVIRLPSGFVVVKVIAVRYPEDAEARAEARTTALKNRQQAVLKAHGEALRKHNAVVKTTVLKGIDYAAPQPGIDALLKDKRVVAEIKGAPPLTVGDLTDYLRLQFFHGGDKVRQGKEMNAKKDAALDATLERRLLNAEALRLGIDKTNAYRDRVNAYRESLIFDSFVQKVIVPDNKMNEEEVKRHYSEHARDYSSPEMLRIRSLAFTGRPAAEKAMRKLREGADYGWMLANAEGQVDKGAAGLLTFDGRPVTTSSMPEGLQKALTGAKSGELRLYGSPEGHFYVLAIQQAIVPNAKPYDEVREEIAKKLYGEKLKRAVEDYAGKLRAHSKVVTFVKKV
jgi:parvulin-like peptidyl-prolyl isomerase